MGNFVNFVLIHSRMKLKLETYLKLETSTRGECWNVDRKASKIKAFTRIEKVPCQRNLAKMTSFAPFVVPQYKAQNSTLPGV